MFLSIIAISCAREEQRITLSHEPEHEETKQLVSLVGKAAALVESRGEEAFAEFRKKDSKWFKGESYIFVTDMSGLCVCHPANPELEGEDMLDLKDVNGKPFIRQFVDAASGDRGAGWSHYEWPKPGKAEPEWKTSYVVRVTAPSGKDYVIGSGLYNMKMEKTFVTDLVDNAVDLIHDKGEEAFDVLRDKAGQFLFKDAYVFVLNDSGLVLAHPATPQLEGQNLYDLQDVNGKLFVREMIDLIKTNESGWVEYMWPKPGAEEPSQKSSYIKKAKLAEETLVVGSGIYFD